MDRLYPNIAMYSTEMRLTKSDLYTFKQNELSNTAKTIAHSLRMSVFEYLFANACIINAAVHQLVFALIIYIRYLEELNGSDIQSILEGVKIGYYINTVKRTEI